MEEQIKLREGVYRHFKGKEYNLIGVAEHTETGEKLVVYMALYDDHKIYVRPLESFTSKVDKDKYPNNPQIHRFQFDRRFYDKTCGGLNNER